MWGLIPIAMTLALGDAFGVKHLLIFNNAFTLIIP
jgi:hypothetical protein